MPLRLDVTLNVCVDDAEEVSEGVRTWLEVGDTEVERLPLPLVLPDWDDVVACEAVPLGEPVIVGLVVEVSVGAPLPLGVAVLLRVDALLRLCVAELVAAPLPLGVTLVACVGELVRVGVDTPDVEGVVVPDGVAKSDGV